MTAAQRELKPEDFEDIRYGVQNAVQREIREALALVRSTPEANIDVLSQTVMYTVLGIVRDCM